jgi:hypothetical protein
MFQPRVSVYLTSDVDPDLGACLRMKGASGNSGPRDPVV